jgi:hypothetical protein
LPLLLAHVLDALLLLPGRLHGCTQLCLALHLLGPRYEDEMVDRKVKGAKAL